MPATESDALRLRLDVPDSAAPGESVEILFRVENVSDRPLDLYLRGRTIAFDVVVTDERGEVVWRRLGGEIVPAILRIETLGPGRAIELTERWDQRTDAGSPVDPGLYSVRAELLTEDRPLISATEPFRIGG